MEEAGRNRSGDLLEQIFRLSHRRMHRAVVAGGSGCLIRQTQALITRTTRPDGVAFSGGAGHRGGRRRPLQSNPGARVRCLIERTPSKSRPADPHRRIKHHAGDRCRPWGGSSRCRSSRHRTDRITALLGAPVGGCRLRALNQTRQSADHPPQCLLRALPSIHRCRGRRRRTSHEEPPSAKDRGSKNRHQCQPWPQNRGGGAEGDAPAPPGSARRAGRCCQVACTTRWNPRGVSVKASRRLARTAGWRRSTGTGTSALVSTGCGGDPTGGQAP